VIDKKKTSDFEKLQGQLSSFIAMFVESSDAAQTDFTSRVQTPLFTAMSKANVVDAFAGIALSPLKLAGTQEWAKAHDKEISAYFDWMRPQLERARVLLPKS
jgi:hypothetical protein